MSVYHILVQSFPIVLWYTATLIILIRLLSDSSTAKTLGASVRVLILFGVLGGAVAYVLGLLAWPLSATTASPLGRNHLLMASWTMAYWSVVYLFALKKGPAIWEKGTGWLYFAMAAFGSVLVTITGTLGGSAAGSPSSISDVVRALGWEVYTTMYVPTSILFLTLGFSALLVALVIWGRQQDE